MFKPYQEVTKKVVEAYERHRSAGNYNMVTDASIVMDLLQISADAYWSIIRHYREYLDYFGIQRMD